MRAEIENTPALKESVCFDFLKSTDSDRVCILSELFIIATRVGRAIRRSIRSVRDITTESVAKIPRISERVKRTVKKKDGRRTSAE